MDKYLDYFKRGWWAQLVMGIFQVAVVLLLIPVVMLFLDNKTAIYTAATILYILALVPFSGWLFLKFSEKFEAPK